MITPPEPFLERNRSQKKEYSQGWSLRLTSGGLLILLSIDLLVILGIAYSFQQTRQPGLAAYALEPSPTTTPEELLTSTVVPPTETQNPFTLAASPPPLSITPVPLEDPISFDQGLIVLAVKEGLYSHLFAYQPQAVIPLQTLPLTRLTGGDWDDTSPALSPDGTQLAFASNRGGYWDIYLMDLASGATFSLTESPEYDASPSWSPDGLWLVFETYANASLEIVIQDIAREQPAVFLTDNPAADFNPVWSPEGRQIAFVSNRSGEDEIWLADLDKAEEDRFRNVSQNSIAVDSYPAWSPDGKTLAWSALQDGFHSLYTREVGLPDSQPAYFSSGDRPVFSPDGQTLLTLLLTPEEAYLTAYPVDDPGVVLPPLALPGPVSGMDWQAATLPWPLSPELQQAAVQTPAPLWQPEAFPPPDAPAGRQQLVALPGVSAPYAFLQDPVDESFQTLRSRVIDEAGWDVLANLQNAYVPLTTPLEPGLGDDWLYTGRAFALDPAPLYSGWLAVVREDFGQQTYWRVFVRARLQDGSLGQPLRHQPWDLANRHTGENQVYENGGELASLAPEGYWVDLTRLAQAFGWQRAPALSSWRYYFPATRFNQFALTHGLEFRQAMLELYPPEALVTPTAIIPPTRTPTPTSRWYPGPTATSTATTRPTYTPVDPVWYLPDTPTPTVVPLADQGSFLPADYSDPHPPQTIGNPQTATEETGAGGILANEAPGYTGALQALFPAPVSVEAPALMPPLYAAPRALAPFDHFYFIRPIETYNLNWIQADYRYGGTFFPGVVHTGVDIAARKGTPVVAAGTGNVVWTGYGLFRGAYDIDDPYGLAVAIKHDFSYQEKAIFTVYGHLDRIDVINGQYVSAGEVLGFSGETGKVTGPHLHFEVRVGNSNFFTTRNPELWLVPPQGWGVVAGRVMNTGGLLLTAQPVIVQSKTTGQHWIASTYSLDAINSDPYYGENVVIGDLPPDVYEIRIPYLGFNNRSEIVIQAGRITYFSYQGRKGYSTQPPAIPGTDFTP